MARNAGHTPASAGLNSVWKRTLDAPTGAIPRPKELA
jgi:hypothetical protein